MLIDRGLVEAIAPVADVLAGVRRKRQAGHRVSPSAVAHAPGVSGWDQPFVVEDIFDWEKSTAALAAQAPWWEPGTASGYHALNYGHLIGEVLRRVTGKTLKEFVRDEIAGPLGADFQIGAKPEDTDRIAEIIPADGPARPAADATSWPEPMLKTFTGRRPTPADREHRRRGGAADIGGANGHGNARALARILSAISLGGTVNGVQLLRPGDHRARSSRCSPTAPTWCWLNHPLRFGPGIRAARSANPSRSSPTGKICFWGGWGGSWETMNPDRRATVAYVMNKMAPGIEGSPRTDRYFTLIYEAFA